MEKDYIANSTSTQRACNPARLVGVFVLLVSGPLLLVRLDIAPPIQTRMCSERYAAEG
jgi:hypothetical protein